jgi:hypothetical protein
MKRIVIAAVAVALSTAAMASEKTRAPTSKPKQPSMSELEQAKAAYRAAVGACARPDTCDPTASSANRDAVALLKDTEKQFMTACTACASEERCESERQRIRDGKRSVGRAPCDKP